MNRRMIRCSVLILVALALLTPAAPADASCWDCYVRYIGGSELGLDDWFVWCGPSETGDIWDCWLDGEGNCHPFGVCIDYILV